MSDWPHQTKAIQDTIRLMEQGKRRICLTSPTGGGKSRIMRRLIEWMSETGGKSLLFTNRRMLLEQTVRGLRESGIECGVRAAGHVPEFDKPVQVAMIATEESRVYRSGKWNAHPADLVLVDEAHVNKGPTMQKHLDFYVDAGSAVVGVTATPVDLGGVYTELVVAGTNSELRKCGSHVPCITFAPDEPDCRGLKPTLTGEYPEGEVVKRIMTPTILDRVFERWNEKNPDRLPSLGFAPGVRESLWFAEQFFHRGVKSAHIDGESIWVDGQEHASSQELRDEIAERSKGGDIKIVWNRFVLREGIDWPWIRVGVMATIFGSVTSYLQSGGRLIRASPGKDSCILIDHGGNWWRHGSLNADRIWHLGDTCKSVAGERQQKLSEGKEDEPIRCPNCGAVRLKGDTCMTCNFRHSKRSRPVIQLDGTVKMVEGKIFRPRKIKQEPDTAAKWERVYWRALRSGMTFTQAEGLFYRENKYWPPKGLPLMPVNEVDFVRKAKDVGRDRLIPKPKRETVGTLFPSGQQE